MTTARLTAILVGLAGLAAVLVGVRLAAGPRPPAGADTAFLVGRLGELDAAAAVAALTASPHPGVILFDRPAERGRQPAVLDALRVTRVVPVGAFDETADQLAARLARPVADPLTWPAGSPPTPVWCAAFPAVTRVVIAPAEPRSGLARAMQVAAVRKAPLVLVRDPSAEADAVRAALGALPLERVYAVGAAKDWAGWWPGVACDLVPGG